MLNLSCLYPAVGTVVKQQVIAFTYRSFARACITDDIFIHCQRASGVRAERERSHCCLRQSARFHKLRTPVYTLSHVSSGTVAFGDPLSNTAKRSILCICRLSNGFTPKTVSPVLVIPPISLSTSSVHVQIQRRAYEPITQGTQTRHLARNQGRASQNVRITVEPIQCIGMHVLTAHLKSQA